VVVIVDVESGIELKRLEDSRVGGGVEQNGIRVWFDVGKQYEWDGVIEGGIRSVVVHEYFELVVVAWFLGIRGSNRIGFGWVAVKCGVDGEAGDKVVVREK
jgi:hypothetical protein